MELPEKSIVFFDLKDWEKPHILNIFSEKQVVFVSGTANKDNASAYAGAVVLSCFVDSKIDASIIDAMPNLKMISVRATGFDNVDIAYARKKNIDVCNVPNYGQNTVAEHAMALLLSLTKRMYESMERVRHSKFSPDGLTGVDLKDKVLGVIGTGNIGCNMISMAKGFKMNVIAYDSYPKKGIEEEMGFTYVSMDYLLAKSDFISIHVPYCEDTHHLINKDSIAKMKNGVFVINTSRGGIIETGALFDGLRSGKIGGAGLDVVEEEAFIKDELELLANNKTDNIDLKIALENHMMAYLPNVIITPHNAFNTKEALIRIIKTALDNIVSYTKSDLDLKNLVNK